MYEISDLVIDLARQRVTRAADEIALPKLSFDLLLVLIRAAPAVLSNNELMARVWPGLVVSPETVSQRVSSAPAAPRRAPPFIDPPGYARHRPEETLLYQLIEQHYPAFSCQGRASVRAAALLADEVLPRKPLRQWVLSLPFALRFLLATDPQALTRVLGTVLPRQVQAPFGRISFSRPPSVLAVWETPASGPLAGASCARRSSERHPGRAGA